MRKLTFLVLALQILALAEERSVVKDQAEVLSSPSTTADIVGKLRAGKRVWALDEDNGYSKIRSRSRRNLWVRTIDLGKVPDEDSYDLDRDVEAFGVAGDFKRIKLDLGASAGRISNQSFIEGAVGLEYFMMERLSWRNAIFYRRLQVSGDFVGLDTSARGNGGIPMGPLTLRGILGAGYRFAAANQSAPFLEVGGFAAFKGFDVGLMLKYLDYSIFDSTRQDTIIYSVVWSGEVGFL